jgi:hypothetical protein
MSTKLRVEHYSGMLFFIPAIVYNANSPGGVASLDP